MKSIKQRANEWIAGEDTGMSSKALWAACMGVKSNNAMAPSDPSDFGRCYRLLELIPEWGTKAKEVSAISSEWALLVENWERLSKLYQEEYPKGTAPKLYEAMQELQKKARAK